MEMLENSVLVAAHPDDEILWFSSVLSRMDQVVLCFLPVQSNPIWTQGRRESLAAYPLDNVGCLELPESNVFWGADWRRPVPTEYGLKITDKRLSDTNYIENFEALKQRLRAQLQGRRNVFTHNPWGEYGHVEHVQVYRAVKSLQEEMRFSLWFTCYVSNKSAGLMASVLAERRLESLTLETDKALAERIADSYKANACWTWYEDYAWPDRETFIRDDALPSAKASFGTTVSMNFIKIEPPPVETSRIARRITRLRRKMGL